MQIEFLRIRAAFSLSLNRKSRPHFYPMCGLIHWIRRCIEIHCSAPWLIWILLWLEMAESAYRADTSTLKTIEAHEKWNSSRIYSKCLCVLANTNNFRWLHQRLFTHENIVCALGVSTGSILSAMWVRCSRLGTSFGRLNLHDLYPCTWLCRWRSPSDIRPELTPKPGTDSHMCLHWRVTRVNPEPSCCARARTHRSSTFIDLLRVTIDSIGLNEPYFSVAMKKPTNSKYLRMRVLFASITHVRVCTKVYIHIDLHNACNCILGSKYCSKFANFVCFQWFRTLFLSISRSLLLASLSRARARNKISSAYEQNPKKLQCFCMIQYSYGLNMK